MQEAKHLAAELVVTQAGQASCRGLIHVIPLKARCSLKNLSIQRFALLPCYPA